MKKMNIIVGLDIGTTKVCTVVGTTRNQNIKSEIEIIGVGLSPSYGLKKGTVVNIDNTVKSILFSIEEAKLMAGVDITRASISIAGSHIYSFNSSGVIAIKNQEVSRADIDRVLEVAKAFVVPPDREILHIILQEFKIDSITGVKNPLGMCGVRLEVYVHIVTGSIPAIKNLVKCVELAGISVDNITLQPFASSQAVLSIEEKELGIVLIDIGGGTTDIAIWNNSGLVHSQVIPVGGNHFTNDLAVAFKISFAEAERIKTNHGLVLDEMINRSTRISVQGLPGNSYKEISLKIIAEVLRARAEELIYIIKKNAEKEFPDPSKITGYVLTGGGVLIKGFGELAEKLLKRPCRIGYPNLFKGMTEIIQNPKFSTVLGLLLESNEKTSLDSDMSNLVGDNTSLIGKFRESCKSIFSEIF